MVTQSKRKKRKDTYAKTQYKNLKQSEKSGGDKTNADKENTKNLTKSR